jgi:hypothetical protein
LYEQKNHKVPQKVLMMFVHAGSLRSRGIGRIVVREIRTLANLYGSRVALIVADGLSDEIVGQQSLAVDRNSGGRG